MSTPKVGDRVHVEFEGEVQAIHGGDLWVTSQDLGTTPGPRGARVHHSACTVITPPVKVGDVATAAQLLALPNLSHVTVDNGHYGRVYRKHDGDWYAYGQGLGGDAKANYISSSSPVVTFIPKNAA
jgi:hypothetical protein